MIKTENKPKGSVVFKREIRVNLEINSLTVLHSITKSVCG
jgi:hypothetical protein